MIDLYDDKIKILNQFESLQTNLTMWLSELGEVVLPVTHPGCSKPDISQLTQFYRRKSPESPDIISFILLWNKFSQHIYGLHLSFIIFCMNEKIRLHVTFFRLLMNNVPISSILILRFGNNEYSSFFKFWSWAKENWTWKTEARYWPEIWRNGLPVNSARQSTGEVRGSLVDLIWERTDKLNEGQRVIQKSIQPN